MRWRNGNEIEAGNTVMLRWRVIQRNGRLIGLENSEVGIVIYVLHRDLLAATDGGATDTAPNTLGERIEAQALSMERARQARERAKAEVAKPERVYCINCAAWGGEKSGGSCRRRPPSLSDERFHARPKVHEEISDVKGKWPFTRPDEWCLEGVAKEPTPDKAPRPPRANVPPPPPSGEVILEQVLEAIHAKPIAQSVGSIRDQIVQGLFNRGYTIVARPPSVRVEPGSLGPS